MARRRHVEAALLCCNLILGAASTGAAQQVQIPGVTGTIAPDPAIDQEQAAAQSAVSKTVSGVKHAFTFTKNLLLHGGRPPGADALQGLHEGRTVVVHHQAAAATVSAQDLDRSSGDKGEVSEGTVTRIDRGRRQITIRFDNGESDTFHLTDRAASASDPGQDVTPSADATHVVVDYADDSGHKIVQVFKKTS
jgi:hypothetical protein